MVWATSERRFGNVKPGVGVVVIWFRKVTKALRLLPMAGKVKIIRKPAVSIAREPGDAALAAETL